MKLDRSGQEKGRMPVVVLCPVDEQEERFDSMVRLWVEGKISHSFLMRNYPTYDASMLRKALCAVGAKFE